LPFQTNNGSELPDDRVLSGNRTQGVVVGVGVGVGVDVRSNKEKQYGMIVHPSVFQ
jgi:hypothetical protein